MAYTLTDQEKQVMRLVYEGLSDREIAQELNLSLKRVRLINEHVREKTNRPTRMAAAIKARQDGQL